MDIKIICEEAYEKSIWCKQILSGLTTELKKKRLHYGKSNQIEDIGNNSSVYIIGTNHNWLSHAIHFCNSKSTVPIVLCNQANRIIRGQYHCVCADTYGMIKQLYDDFTKSGRTQIALYGVNSASISDMSRMKCFLELTPDKENVFENNGNLEACFQNFLPEATKYDAVICVNGYAAISLVKKLGTAKPDVLETLSIVSCTEMLLSSRYNNWISFVDLNLEKYGKAAITISEIAENNPYIASTTITVAGKTADSKPRISDNRLEKYMEYRDLFYEDSEFMHMSKIEHLLSQCSELDYQILELLLQNATYSEIAECCFMSEGTVKYHIKKYMEICDVKTKQELLTLLQNYYALK